MRTLAVLAALPLAQQVELTVQGALIMAGCVVLVLGLNIFCMSRILRERHPEEHHHAPLDIDTKDTNG
jgi:hypothetical protein